MVVRRDLDFPRVQLLHRMVAAVVSKLQLEGFPAQSYPRELMSQANPKNWLTSHKSPNVVHRVGARLRIARPVGQEYAIRFQREHVFRQSLRRHHRDLAAFAAQLAQDVLLDAVVVSHYMKCAPARL